MPECARIHSRVYAHVHTRAHAHLALHVGQCLQLVFSEELKQQHEERPRDRRARQQVRNHVHQFALVQQATEELLRGAKGQGQERKM
eukprot:25378-Chlamydomonas_euryale.AAC.1